MTDYIVLYFVFQKIFAALVTVALVSGIMAFISFLRAGSQEEKAFLKKAKRWSITFCVFCALAIITPKDKEIIAYMCAHEVDKYNLEHKDSKVKTKTVIETVDNILKISDKVIKKIDGKIGDTNE